MDELSKPTKDITFEDVQAFCKHGFPESQTLDYKSKLPENKKIAEEVAAFANAQGGLLLFGVHEKGLRPAKDQPGCDLGGDPQAQVVAICLDRIHPPIRPDVSPYIPNPEDPSRGFMVVQIPACVEIHTLEYRTKIPIRCADQKRQRLATLEEIECLLARRNEQRQAQQRRRDSAIDQLRMAVQAGKKQHGSQETTRGILWVSVGPVIDERPRVSRQRIKELAPKVAAYPCYDPGDPIFPKQSRSLGGVQDGVYTVGIRPFRAALADVFGNVVTYTELLRPYKFSIHTDPEDFFLEWAPKDTTSDETMSVEAKRLVERIIACVRTACNMHGATGFAGFLEISVLMEGTKGVPLVTVTERRTASILTVCETLESISASVYVLGSELNNDEAICESIKPIVSQILWSWGCATEEHTDPILDLGEGDHFGFDKCPCEATKPKSREECFQCRAKGSDTRTLPTPDSPAG